MSDQTAQPQEPSFWQKLWRIIWTFFLIIIIIALIAAAVYFVAPFVYQEYVEPVQEHSFRLDTLAEQAAQMDERYREQMESMAERLQELELQNDMHKSNLAGFDERLTLVESSQGTQADSIEALLPLLAAAADLEKQTSELQSDIQDIRDVQDVFKSDVETLMDNLSELEEAQTGNSAGLEDQQAGLETLTVQTEMVLQEIKLLKTMELITRARYNLVEGNLSLVRADLQSARDIAAGLQAEAPAYQSEILAEIEDRLETSLINLPGSPLSAADQLEAAWQLLIEGLPGEPGEVDTSEDTATPTPTPTP